MEVNDILLDDNLDLRIESGDLVVGESTLQHQNLLLISEPGEWKQSPAIGIGIRSFLLDSGTTSELKKNISKGFEDDGMKIRALRISTDYKLTVEAYYNG